MTGVDVLLDDGHLRVVDDAGASPPRRILSFAPNFRIKQGFIHLDDPLFIPGPAFQKQLFGASLAPRLDAALVLGMGVGSVPAALRDLEPGARIDIVEIDARVLDVAARFFHRDLAAFVCHCADARAFVAEPPAVRYDYVCIDLWHGDDIPGFVLEDAFWRQVRALTGDDGIVSLNIRYLHQKQAIDAIAPHFARMLSLRDNNAALVLFAGDGRRNAIDAPACARFARYGTDVAQIAAEAWTIERAGAIGAWPHRFFHGGRGGGG